MSARGAWDHRQVDSDVAEHRDTVSRHLVALADQPGHPEQVTAAELAATYPELPVDRWLGVLAGMSRLGHAGETSRSLYVAAVDEDPVRSAYALGMEGWKAARRLTVEAVAS